MAAPMADAEATIKRNPHGDFKATEASRAPWDESLQWEFRQTKNPAWKLGDGANDGGACLEKEHVQIDPYEEGRPAVANYKLLTSAIVPRPVGFISTRNKDGSMTNLAPFSYTQMVSHEPPVFIVGFAGGYDRCKDTLRNLTDTRECSINMISEHFLEAANATSINSPYGTSEWALSGLTPAPCTEVKCSRVKESVFSIEGRLMEIKEFESKASPGKMNAAMGIIEGVKFWVREDALNEERNNVDPNVLRAMGRMGGITYSRTVHGVEIPRPDFEQRVKEDGAEGLLKPKADAQNHVK